MALRIWIQVSARPVDTDSATVLFSVTRDLARPAELITGSPPLQETGVIDITTLVAMEAYFIATLAAIVLVLTYGEGRGILTARARKAPPFAAELEREGRRRPLWQPIDTARHPGIRFYLPIHRRDDTATRSMTTLAHVKGSTSLR
jgi:hypothetical protein